MLKNGGYKHQGEAPNMRFALVNHAKEALFR
jgi:hypothetical protein